MLYGPKTSGTWPTPGISLVGPAGPAGSSDAWQSGGDDAGIFLEGDSVFASIATVQVPAGKYHVSFTGWAQTTSSGGDVFCDFASYGGFTLATVPPYSSLTYGYGNASLAAQKTIDVSFSSSSTISFQCEGPRTVLVGGVLDALQVTTVQSQ